MTTIYVLTEGDYSDYRIVALYSTLELAEEAQKLCPDSIIEEYKLDSEIPDHPQDLFGWSVTIDVEDNTIRSTYQEDVISRPFEPQENYYENRYLSSNTPPLFVVKCWARDQEHAEKIALDKFYQFKAQQAGL